MARIRKYIPVVTPIESEVPCTFQAVGRAEWFYRAFEPNTFDLSEMLVISDPSELAPVHKYLERLKVAGVDSETSGPATAEKSYAMDPLNKDTQMVLLQIGSENHVFLIEPALAIYFKAWLEGQGCLKLLHNALYDFKWLLVKYGIHVDRIFCSMLSQQAITAGVPGSRVGLADVAREYEPHYLVNKAVRAMFIHMNNGMMTRKMAMYAVRDVPLLFPVFRGELEVVKAKKLEKTCQTEFDVLPVTAEMELVGINLHQKRLKHMIRYWLMRQAEMETRIIDEVTHRLRCEGKGSNFIIPELKEMVDLQSNQQKLKLLKSLGYELDDVRRDTLKEIDDPIAAMLAEYSNITKFTSTYGQNMLDKLHPETGRWHPRFSQMGAGGGEDTSAGGDTKGTTATGRYSGDAQQAPRKMDRYCEENDPVMAAEVLSHFADVILQIDNPVLGEVSV